jgi:hypothetical protein
MAQNLITRNGQAVHAQIGVTGVPQCKPNMRSAGFAPVAFLTVDADQAPVTCKSCCRKLGTTAPKSLPTAKTAKTAKTAPVLAPVDVEAERLAIVERAEVEVRCEGGTLMDQLQAMAEYHAKYVMRPRRRR